MPLLPWLGLIFQRLTLFSTGIFGFFLTMFGRKFTVITATVLALVATTVTFIVCLKSILTGVVALLAIPTWILTFIGWFIPSNAISVISAILSGRICKEAYRLINVKIDLIAKSN